MDSITCDCENASKQHCHCPCSICNFKPVSKTTAHRHLCNIDQEHLDANACSSLNESSVEEDEIAVASNGSIPYSDASDTVSDINSGKDKLENPGRYETLLELLSLKDKHKMSNKCFEDILKWSNRQILDERSQLPELWSAVQKALGDAGCIPPRVYYICLHEDHPCHSDILDSDIALCRHCGRPGSVKYYYLSLIGKVKAWTQQKAMCEKMLTHWKERDHWLHCDRNESNSCHNEFDCVRNEGTPGDILVRRKHVME